jgi:hypothetical protein
MYSLPANFVLTIQNEGSDDNIDSDVDTTTGMTPPFTLANNDFNTSMDAGMYLGNAKQLNQGPAIDVKLYPNPVHDQLFVDIVSNEAADYWVNLSDLSGKLIQRKQFKLEEGHNKMEIATNEINDGIYLLNVLSQGVKKSFMVQVIH